MAKFNERLATAGAARTATGPIKSGRLDRRTGNGAPAFSRDAKSDLFLLAVTNFVSEDTFYESGGARDSRFENLVHEVTAHDPAWMQAFIPWLRNEANMRSASLVAAAEYVKAGGPNGRQVVASAMARADEPSEMLAYWIARYGRQIPQPIKRGVADAAQKFYNERNVLKYDGDAKSVKMADVIQLAHVKPKTDWQSALFKYVLAKRYDNDDQMAEALQALPVLSKNRAFRQMEPARARALLLNDPDDLASAGFTWESFSSLGKMDAAAWEAMIPNMGYMALLRNLRNFDEAGVSDEVAAQVIAKLSDPEEVARSRQLPFRFWSAYKNTPSLRWSYPLEQALDLSCQNVPEFRGKTLVLVDTSGSMENKVSGKSTASRIEIAGLFGSILAKRNSGRVVLKQFASNTQTLPYRVGESALSIQRNYISQIGAVGHGTDVAGAVSTWKDEDRIIILSDLQTTTQFTRSGAPGWGRVITAPARVPIYGFNLAGYSATPLASGNLQANEHEMGGLTDKTFQMINLIEQAKSTGWPWSE